MACELPDKNQCTTDMLSFKGYVHRWLAVAAQVAAPVVHDMIMPVLNTSAQGMLQGCLPDGTCGFRWNWGRYDGKTGAGQQMNALGALISMLVEKTNVHGPLTDTTGGTSIGNPNAGYGEGNILPVPRPITAKDLSGAWAVTASMMFSLGLMLIWMCSSFGEGPAWTDPMVASLEILKY